MTADELVEVASRVAGVFAPSDDCTVGGVAAALVTAASNVYTGVCIDTSCSLGFCAEHAAIAEMLKAHESDIRLIVAIDTDGATAIGRVRGLTARGESLAAFDGRCIPAGCVAPRSNTLGILGRRALPAGRLARLGATPDFHHGLLTRIIHEGAD